MGNDYINNDTFQAIDFSAYPPCLVAWPIFIADTICDHCLGGLCSDWRSILPEKLRPEGGASWFSVTHKQTKTPNQYMPELLSYQDFLDTTTDGSNSEGEPPFSLASMKRFAFATSSTSLASVLSWPSLIALVVLVSCIRLIKAMCIPTFSNIARTYCRKTHGPNWEKEKANEQRILKFGEYVFRLLFHSSISLVAIFLFYDKPWWSSVLKFFTSNSSVNEAAQLMGTKSLYIDYPFQPVDPGMAWYYLVQFAYNAEAMISLLEISFRVEYQPIQNRSNKSWQLPIRIEWSESCRGDFREMFVHHIFTNLLIIGSSFYRLQYAGSMVFLVHDVSDIPVDLSKLANFLKWKTTTTICFVSMCITWLLTRLYILPFIVWRSMIYEAWLVCTDGYLPPMYYNMFQPIFLFGLGFLILLHFFWFTMFIRMGYVLIRKGEAHDLSEHKNGEVQCSSSEAVDAVVANGGTNDSNNGVANGSSTNVTKKTN